MKTQKRIAVIIPFLIFYLGVLHARAQLIKQWVDTNITTSEERPSKIRIDSDGNIYTLATVTSSPRYMLTKKFNASGELLWQDTLSEQNIYAKDMQVDPSGNVYSFGEEGGSGSPAWVVKYSPSGEQQWIYTTPPHFVESTARIRIDNAGNVVLGYESLDSLECTDPDTQEDYFFRTYGIRVIKIDATGSVVMNFHYQPATCTGFIRISDGVAPFDIDNFGNTYFTYTQDNQLNHTITYNVMKVNGSGGMDWNHTYFVADSNNQYTLYKNNLLYDHVTQHVLAVFSTADGSYPPGTLYVTAINTSGDFLWQNTSQGSIGGIRTEIDDSGNIFYGYYSSFPYFTIKKISPTGTLLWSVVPSGSIGSDGNFPIYDETSVFKIDNSGNLFYYEKYPPDLSAWRINKVSSTGILEWQYVDAHPEVSSFVTGFVIDSNVNLYLYDRVHLTKYSPCNCPLPVALNLNIFLEGFYLGNHQMLPLLYNMGLNSDLTACDTITVELHDATTPYGLVADPVQVLLHSDGNAVAVFPVSIDNNPSYYIAVKHRNSIETWSKNPVLFNSTVVHFDFTTP